MSSVIFPLCIMLPERCYRLEYDNGELLASGKAFNLRSPDLKTLHRMLRDLLGGHVVYYPIHYPWDLRRR